MICVLLGASFYFVSFCLLLVRIVFCIFSFNKKSRIAFAMLILLVCMLLFENRKFTAFAKKSLENSENGIMLNLFAY